MWDVLGGNRLLHRAASHQKTVTCLHVAAAAGADSTTRLLSASLDGLLKVCARHALLRRCPVNGAAADACTQHLGAGKDKTEAATPGDCYKL